MGPGIGTQSLQPRQTVPLTRQRADDASSLSARGLASGRQTLDGVAAELGELVEEQDTVVPEGSQMYLDGLG